MILNVCCLSATTFPYDSPKYCYLGRPDRNFNVIGPGVNSVIEMIVQINISKIIIGTGTVPIRAEGCNIAYFFYRILKLRTFGIAERFIMND